MDDAQKRMIEKLAGCRFGVGSYAKRFVTDMHWQARHKPEVELSPRQDWYLRRLYYEYRKQIGWPNMPKPVDYHTPPVGEKTEDTTELATREAAGEIIVCRPRVGADRKLAEELARLKAWNEGKPR